jgi:hypothetical protein
VRALEIACQQAQRFAAVGQGALAFAIDGPGRLAGESGIL